MATAADLLVGDRGGRPPFAAGFLVAAFLAAAPTGKPLGLAAAAGGGRRSEAGVGAGGVPFFLVAPGSGACRTASLRDGVGSERKRAR